MTVVGSGVSALSMLEFRYCPCPRWVGGWFRRVGVWSTRGIVGGWCSEAAHGGTAAPPAVNLLGCCGVSEPAIKSTPRRDQTATSPAAAVLSVFGLMKMTAAAGRFTAVLYSGKTSVWAEFGNWYTKKRPGRVTSGYCRLYLTGYEGHPLGYSLLTLVPFYVVSKTCGQFRQHLKTHLFRA